jgi:hypothetical protein
MLSTGNQLEGHIEGSLVVCHVACIHLERRTQNLNMNIVIISPPQHRIPNMVVTTTPYLIQLLRGDILSMP